MTSSVAQTTATDYPTGIFTSEFTGNEPFLADHVIQEKKILPGMAYLEMVRAAVASVAEVGDEHLIVLNDSVFIQPLIVTEKCSVEIKVYPGARGEYGVEVSTKQGVHFQSKAYIHQRVEAEVNDAVIVPLDIQELEQQCTIDGPGKAQIYQNFKEMGVCYGPSHQGFDSIKIGDDCALATLSLPGSSARGMDLNPGMLDSIIQCGAALASHSDGISVPFAVKSTKIYGPLTDKLYAFIDKTDDGMNYTVADEAGDIKVQITGFVSRAINLSPKKDEVVYYTPKWKENDLPGESNSQAEVTVMEGHSRYSELVAEVFQTAQKLIQAKSSEHVLEVNIPADKPSWRGIVAALKTISLEYPKISFRLITNSKMLTLDYTPSSLATDSAHSWSDGHTTIITGGLGGVGLLIAIDIATHSKDCTLVLVGRSELDDKKRMSIEQLKSIGAKVTYEVCDVSNRNEVNEMVAKYPHVNGIVHASGVLRDSYIISKNIDDIDMVLAPKVSGLQYLDEATAELKPEYFIVLSSLAGTMGNAGQIDYAAANGYMDAYMADRADRVERNERHGKSISINWPLWESGGMQVDEVAKQHMMQVLKLKPLPSEAGLLALKEIIGSEHNQQLVLFGDKDAIDSLFGKATKKVKKAVPKTHNVETGKLTREILKEVRMRTAEQLKLQPHQLDEEADWAEFGFDSILLSGFVNDFNSEFGLDLMPTALFEATNMLLFSEYLTENYATQMSEKLSVPSEVRTKAAVIPKERNQQQISAFAKSLKKSYKASVAYREKDIAIVGMSCRVAGARNLEEFWEILIQEKDMITEIPSDRWDWRAYEDTTKWGSFIDGVAEFDPLFFGISPAEALYMVPEQRLMMQHVWECLEHAGCGGDSIKGTNTGIFVGCGPSGYSALLSNMPIQAYTSTGMVPSVGPNRISYLMDWHGPSEPIETACSSALVALHRAVEAIRAGHCDQAITGGVNLLLNPEAFTSFTKAGMLSEDGRCKTFSDKANGYVRGEGIGILLLKPLKAAVRDGNNIMALVKGTAENHGGRTNSLTAPNPKSQAAVIKRAIKDADVDFGRISYIECHGTGTELGDPVETEGLKMVASQLVEEEDNDHKCIIGSIKSNIGHLEMAAGVVGIIKVVLQMQHKKIAKSLHSETLNSYIDLTNSPFEVAQQATDWQVEPGQTRVAGVSSFGFGGVNAHVILEEYIDLNPTQEEQLEQGAEIVPQLLIISARNEESLIDYIAQYPSFIDTIEDNSATLQRIAYSLQLGRSEMQERVAFVANSVEEWREQLDKFLQAKGKVTGRNIYRGTVKGSEANKLELGDTQAGRDYIQQLVDSNEHGKLAELWVKGSKIDWQTLWKR